MKTLHTYQADRQQNHHVVQDEGRPLDEKTVHKSS